MDGVDRLLTIGKLARQAGVSVQTIRYYERRGLILEPPRSSSGYRLYDPSAIKRLAFVRKAQVLGFSLDEVDELLSLRTRPGTTCADIQERARQKINTVDHKISELTRMRGALTTLAARCRGRGPTSECPILEAFEARQR